MKRVFHIIRAIVISFVIACWLVSARRITQATYQRVLALRHAVSSAADDSKKII